MATTGRIAFEGVWKEFQRGPAHDSLRDLIPALTRRLFPGHWEPAKSKREAFWALRDVSFDVGPGHCMGIIGGNGAGKSTALKILTGILQPTRGASILNGRVGALIEVSAGFHQDLTGRENVFLQGAIMGMKRDEIRRRFDDIVDFSGISEFIDTPVKRYSSGMNARLGFSIAVHLEPDAMIVDEVLSVGDASFQHRAFDRLSELVKGQIPAVIVSHQLDRVIQLCDTCLVLDHGQVRFNGPPSEAVERYLAPESDASAVIKPECPLDQLSIIPEWSGEVQSGTTIGAVLKFGLTEATFPAHLEPLLLAHSLASNAIVYGLNLRGLSPFSGGIGLMQIPVDLDVNLIAGNYRVQLSIWDPVQGRTVGRSGSASILVTTDRPFTGPAQLNLRIKTHSLRPPSSNS